MGKFFRDTQYPATYSCQNGKAFRSLIVMVFAEEINDLSPFRLAVVAPHVVVRGPDAGLVHGRGHVVLEHRKID